MPIWSVGHEGRRVLADREIDRVERLGHALGQRRVDRREVRDAR